MKPPARKTPNTRRVGPDDRLESGSPREHPTGTTPNSCGPARIDPQWAWHHRTLLRLRDRLLRARADHSMQASDVIDLSAADAVDSAQEEAVRDILWAELGAEGDRLFEIDCALQRLRDGSYGRCEETGVDIPAERLRALPWTRYCRAAAQRLEERKNGHAKRPQM